MSLGHFTNSIGIMRQREGMAQMADIDKAKAIRFPSSSELMIGVAFACNSAWIQMSFKSLNLYANYSNSENLLDTVYFISILSVIITLLCAGVFQSQVGKFIEKKWARILIPLGITLSTLMMPLAGLEGAVGSLFLICSGLLSGIFSGLFLLYFGMVFSRLTTRSAVIAAATGSILSNLIFALFLLFSPFEATIFAASMPCIAAFLLLLNLHSSPQDSTMPIISLSEQSPLSDATERRDLNHLIARLAACSVLVGFAQETARTLYIQMGIVEGGAQSYSIIVAFVTFVTSGGAIFITLALTNTKVFQMPRYCYRAILIFLFVGVALVPVPLIYPQFTTYLPYALNGASYLCFSMMMWVIVAGICKRYSGTRLRTFALIRAGWALGPFLGLSLGRFVLHELGLHIENVFPIMLLTLLALLVVITIVFTESDLMNAMNIIPTERRRRFVEKCQKVIERFGLSEREGEIMIMFAKGRNLAYIQEQLSLSKSTVSTHRQHIYQKLDIHSQQELLDIIQDIS